MQFVTVKVPGKKPRGLKSVPQAFQIPTNEAKGQVKLQIYLHICFALFFSKYVQSGFKTDLTINTNIQKSPSFFCQYKQLNFHY